MHQKTNCETLLKPHQSQITWKQYRSNTQLGNNCKFKTHYNLNPKLHVASLAITYVTTLQNQTPNWVTIANPNHITIKTPNNRFIPQIWDLNHQ